MGHITSCRREGAGCRLAIRCGPLASGTAVGDSIAVNGCCLTVVGLAIDSLEFDAGPETLARTNLGRLDVDDRVNLERSLRAGEPLGGHFVTGHVDDVGVLAAREDQGEWSTLAFQVPPQLTRQMVSKGSVAVDGVSLTLVEIRPDAFTVQLIPHTLSVTTLGNLSIGDPVNIETDLLAKYAQKAMGAE